MINIPPEQRQPYITKETWELIHSRSEAYKIADFATVEKLNVEIKKAVKKDTLM